MVYIAAGHSLLYGVGDLLGNVWQLTSAFDDAHTVCAPACTAPLLSHGVFVFAPACTALLPQHGVPAHQ